MSKSQKQYPATRGLNWHREQYYSFFIPLEWQRFSWDDGHQGVIYGPDPNDTVTVFAVEIQDLGLVIAADDLDSVAEGFFETIEALPEATIEYRNQKASGNRLELEARYTYHEQGQTRKRWVRVYYHDTRQIAVTAQGATPQKYDYWLPWFNEAMMTIRIPS